MGVPCLWCCAPSAPWVLSPEPTGVRRGQGGVRVFALAIAVTVLPSASGSPSGRHAHKSPPPPGPVTLGQRLGRLGILILF